MQCRRTCLALPCTIPTWQPCFASLPPAPRVFPLLWQVAETFCGAQAGLPLQDYLPLAFDSAVSSCAPHLCLLSLGCRAGCQDVTWGHVCFEHATYEPACRPM